MDVKCATCGEPWDTVYLRWELVPDTLPVGEEVIPLDVANALMQFSKDGKLTNLVRQYMKEHGGWEFGHSILVVLHCEACRPGDKLNKEKAFAANMLADLLGDDIDGLSAELEDMDSIFGDEED